MGLTDQHLFDDPRTPTSRRLVELRARRIDLRRKQRDAVIAHQTARNELEQAQRAERQADGRATALDDYAGLKTAKTRLTKATRSEQHAADELAGLSRALDAIDAEMLDTVRNGYAELLDEIHEDDINASNEAELARRALLAALERKRSLWARATVLTSAMHDQPRNRSLREPLRPERAVVEGISSLFPDPPQAPNTELHPDDPSTQPSLAD
jgi:hypothetical protein